MKKIILTIITFGFLFNISTAQDFAPVGTAVGQFLEIGTGARATGLGEAFTAMSSGAEAVMWNPAGLADGGPRSLMFSYNQWPAEISFSGIVFAIKVGRIGTFAIHSKNMMTDDIEITTINQPGGTGETFGITNSSLGLSYARYLTDKVSIGVTGKMVQEKYWDYDYSTMSLDLGTLYRTDFHGLRIGMSMLHFAPEVQFNGEYIDFSDPQSIDKDEPVEFETYSLPMTFRFGAAINVLDNEKHLITLAADMVHPNNTTEQYNFGVEYSFARLFFLRSGYKTSADEGGISFGAGANINVLQSTNITLDYAYSDLGILKNSHRFTISLSL